MAPDRPPDPVVVALDVAAIFERLGLPYFAGGSLASSIHGEPRSTLDIDFVVNLGPAHITPLLSALGRDYYVSEEAMKEALQYTTSFNAIHLSTAVKVDVYVATPEHIVLRKLEWYRRGEEVSDRQWRDVVGVLRVKQGNLDEARMDLWAERLGVTDLLQRAREDARS